MVQLMFFWNLMVMKGKVWDKLEGVINLIEYWIYWWNLDEGCNLWVDIYFVDWDDCGFMVFDGFIYIKNKIDLMLIFC